MPRDKRTTSTPIFGPIATTGPAGRRQDNRPIEDKLGGGSGLSGAVHGQDGIDGEEGPIGPPGLTGLTGPIGATGLQGPPGVPGDDAEEMGFPLGVPVDNVAAGTYTPTLTNVANLDASTAYQAQWIRVGHVVTVSGKVDVDPTLTVTATALGISLPIVSNLGAAEDCAGVAFASGIAGQGAAIRADAANDRAELAWIAGDVTNQPMYFVFQYEII